MIVWALFDSGNGCYKNAAKYYPEIEIYSIGLDREKRNSHFINLDLADYSHMFGDSDLYKVLDQLPAPDCILASPPCESFTFANAMKDGNPCWKQEKGDSLFEPQKPLSRFTIRDYEDFGNVQYNPEKSLFNRINGELCIINTIQIIKRYKPKVFVIENPAASKIWDYIENILGFKIPYENKTFYGNYDYPVKKATRFQSNIDLGLKKEIPKQLINLKLLDRTGGSYNSRSNIPEGVIREIYSKILEFFFDLPASFLM